MYCVVATLSYSFYSSLTLSSASSPLLSGGGVSGAQFLLRGRVGGSLMQGRSLAEVRQSQ